MAQQNPFGQGSIGANAFKAAYDRLKQQSELQKQNIGQNYSDVYQKLRGQQYAQGLGAAAQAGLSGGQASMIRQKIGAAQMGELSNLAQAQERALREQSMSDASIYSNALLEGQQSQDIANQEQERRRLLALQVAQIQSGAGEYAGLSREQRDTLLRQVDPNGLFTGRQGGSGFTSPEVTERGTTRQTAMEDVGVFGANALKIENQYRSGAITYQKAFDLLRQETLPGGQRRYTDQQITNRLRRDGFQFRDLFNY